MRKLLISLILGLLPLACKPVDKPIESPLPTSQTQLACGGKVISGEGIGNLRIGSTADSIKQICSVTRDTTELDNEAMPSRVLNIALGSDTVRTVINSGRVWRIEVRDPDLRTSDSLGVGSSLEQLLKLQAPKALVGEGAVFFVSPDHCGISFRLSKEGSDAPPDNWSTGVLNRLNKSSVVSQLLIVGCTAAL